MAPLIQNRTIPEVEILGDAIAEETIALTDFDLYPESDGKPMAENTEQYRWIVILKENLEILFATMADVFIAADLLWYPVEASKPIPEDFTLRSQAPDVMVIFGRPKGRRGSYKQWQEAQTPPQVVFEILSPSNITRKVCHLSTRRYIRSIQKMTSDRKSCNVRSGSDRHFHR